MQSPVLHSNWISIWTHGCWAQLYSVSKCGRSNSSGSEAVVIPFLLGGVGTATFGPRGKSHIEKQDRGASVPDCMYHPTPAPPPKLPWTSYIWTITWKRNAFPGYLSLCCSRSLCYGCHVYILSNKAGNRKVLKCCELNDQFPNNKELTKCKPFYGPHCFT